MDILRTAIEVAKKSEISTIVVASTTGNTASKLLGLVKSERLRVIVVTHDEGKPLEERRFSDDIRKELEANGFIIYTHNPPLFLLQKIIIEIFKRFNLSPWSRFLKEIKEKYGTGIKVCHIILQMLREGKILKDDKVITIAGTKKGADSIGIFLVRSKDKWPILQEVILSHL